MSQIKLSKKAGLNESFVNGVESCRRGISLKTIFVLSSALDCDPRCLISSSETEFNQTDVLNRNFRKTFGYNLKGMRKTLNLSQDKLAKKSGIGKNTIFLAESNKRNVSLKTIVALALALECDPCDLFNPNIIAQEKE